MKVLVIHGSPRKHGNTYRVLSKIEKEMKRLDQNVEFAYLFLSEASLEMCRGCYCCLELGENTCPLKDDRESIERQMQYADAVIFSSPVYVANVTALYKNFVDRFAYICHRPRFHGKKAMVVCSTGSVASGIVGIIMQMMVEPWGFDVVRRVGAIVSPGISDTDRKKQWEKIDKMAKKAASAFYRAIQDTRRPAASFTKLYAFRLQQAGFAHACKDKADYRYWNEKGWLRPGASYYIDARVNPVKRLIACVFSEIEMKRYPKGNG